MGLYEDALHHYEQAELQTLTEKQLPSRSLRIVAESYAIKGVCLEKQLPVVKSKYKIAELHEKIIKCFETAGDLTLVYLQEQDKMTIQLQNGTATINSNHIGMIYLFIFFFWLIKIFFFNQTFKILSY